MRFRNGVCEGLDQFQHLCLGGMVCWLDTVGKQRLQSAESFPFKESRRISKGK